MLKAFGIPSSWKVFTKRGEVQCGDLSVDDIIITRTQGYTSLFHLLHYTDVAQDCAQSIMRSVAFNMLGLTSNRLEDARPCAKERSVPNVRLLGDLEEGAQKSESNSSRQNAFSVLVFERPQVAILNNGFVRCPSILSVYSSAFGL
ncbi:hypothetical protein [Planktotalea sp.]|uniref:hypothetical protein n=1 Tax=Planktotalea sp. TaxID=2029877 RepID=UPI003D6A14BD